MVGFDTKALILMPDYSSVEEHFGYINKLRVGLNNIVAYLEQEEMEAHGIYTDEVMHDADPAGKVKLFNILPQTDTFFIYKNAVGMKNIAQATQWSQREEVGKKYKSTEGLSDVDRFMQISKNEKRIAQLFIKDYALVFNIAFKGHPNYKATSNQADGKIRIYVDGATLTPSAYLSGEPVDIIDIIGRSWANLPIHEWRVTNE